MGRRPFKCYRYQKNKPYPKSRFNRGVPGKPQHLSVALKAVYSFALLSLALSSHRSILSLLSADPKIRIYDAVLLLAGVVDADLRVCREKREYLAVRRESEREQSKGINCF